ncbi:class IV aminotransferase [Medicago truncatula]|uniref:Class IV aminotransferase n=1 Tax=Medicago truncatula TaxID=3880 RepID=A0A072VG15_MEDTR|nr:class IV aminotransferase [Medicago truncatula]
MKRLSKSIRILSNLAPQLLFKSNNAASLLPLAPNFQVSQPALQMLVNDSVGKVLPIALKEGNGAQLAVAGYGRNVAAAKYSDWARIRKTLEKLRPPSVTELLLSYNGDQILEGCVTNFFVVCRKDRGSDDEKAPYDHGKKNSFKVQTTPNSDGVLLGIIRQLVLEYDSFINLIFYYYVFLQPIRNYALSRNF